MDIAKLRAFLTVAEELNFRKSAEILGMSQPPLTRLISGLEDELGTKLFERTTRQVRLTGAGIVLLKEAREILSAIDRIDRDVRLLGKQKPGALRIGFSATAFLARLPTITEEFEKRFPKIKLDFQQRSPKEILERLEKGHLDIGFAEGSFSGNNLQSHLVHDEHMGVLLPKKHKLAKMKQISFSDLKDETLILHNRKESQEFYDRIMKLIQGLKSKPKVYVKDDQESCPILVAMGKGVSLTIAASQNFAPYDTRFVPLSEMFLPVSVYWKDPNPSGALQSFLSFVIENKHVKPAESGCLVLNR